LGALISGDEGTLSESELAESSDSDPELDESSVSRSDSDFFVGSGDVDLLLELLSLFEAVFLIDLAGAIVLRQSCLSKGAFEISMRSVRDLQPRPAGCAQGIFAKCEQINKVLSRTETYMYD
jgi:hypothetical protein